MVVKKEVCDDRRALYGIGLILDSVDDPLPELGPDDYVVVSALYASAVRATGGDTSRLLLVADPVMTPDGKTFLGCRGLAPVF